MGQPLPSQEVPGIERSCQGVSGVSRMCQVLSGSAKRSQEAPGCSRGCQELPVVVWSSQYMHGRTFGQTYGQSYKQSARSRTVAISHRNIVGLCYRSVFVLEC